MGKFYRHMDSDELGLYSENYMLKLAAANYIRHGGEADKERVLNQLAFRTAMDNGVPTPMTDNGVVMRIAPFTDSEGGKWLPLYTDLDEVMAGFPTDYTVETPMIDLVEEAFGSKSYEGLVINPYTDRVFVDKWDLDLVLDTLGEFYDAC